MTLTQPQQATQQAQTLICPRCDARLFLNYGEPLCVHCGYVDYNYTPPQEAKAKKSLLYGGTNYILRYVGESESLREKAGVRAGKADFVTESSSVCPAPGAKSQCNNRRCRARGGRYARNTTSASRDIESRLYQPRTAAWGGSDARHGTNQRRAKRTGGDGVSTYQGRLHWTRR